MDAALPRFVGSQASLQCILGNPAVPRSLLPELQSLWEEQQQKKKEGKEKGKAKEEEEEEEGDDAPGE